MQTQGRSDELERLIDAPEAAKILGIDLGTLANWRSRNVGPGFVKIGGRVRYSPSGLRDYITARTRSTKAA